MALALTIIVALPGLVVLLLGLRAQQLRRGPRPAVIYLRRVR